jgi:chaperonin GroES
MAAGTYFDFIIGVPACRERFFDEISKNYKVMIKPLADRVVIEPQEAQTKTASGLYIPDTAKEKPQQGTIVAAGPGKKDEPMEVKVGDVVLYGKYAGTEVTVDDKKYLIVKQSDILAII